MLDVLLVDDDPTVRSSIAGALTGAGHRVAEANDGDEALSLLATRPFDVAVCDVRMPKVDGLTLLRRLKTESPGTAVVMMTSFGRIPDVIRTMRDGAVDYVTKPFDPDEFVQNILGPIEERRAHMKRFEEARTQFVGQEAGESLVGASLVVRQLSERITVVSKSDASVLVSGPPGSGKKLVARTLHAQSARRSGPFLIFPCESLAEIMLQSELRELSEMRARKHRDEWFRAAEGGTLVLDGVDRLSLAAQNNLLRVLNEPRVHARRNKQWQPLGVRLVSLASRPAGELLATENFLRPLFFRLNAVHLQVPPLSAREGDLYLLVSHFLREFSPAGRSPPSLTPPAWKTLANARLEGNVRELAWIVEHAIGLSGGADIEVGHLPASVRERRREG